jgi:hypothetical protein
LIVVLGVLSILALLAVTFNSVMTIERSVAKSYLDEVRARLIARSGIEHAMNRLDGIDVGQDTSWAYTSPLPLEKTDRASFFEADAAGNPVLIAVDGVNCSYTSETSSSAYGKDLYAVRMVDCNALINVNDGAKFGVNHSVSQNLKRMLRVLGTLKGVSSAVTDKIVDNRPNGGYRSKYEVLGKMGNDYTSFDAIKNFITASAWEDPTVCEPVPLSQGAMPLYGGITYFRGSPPLYRYGRDFTAGGNYNGGQIVPGDMMVVGTSSGAVAASDERTKVFGVNELNPMWVEITQRAPINVNAASREVLVVALAGLKGFFRLEKMQNNPSVALKMSNSLGHLGNVMMYSWGATGTTDGWTGQKLGYGHATGTAPSATYSPAIPSNVTAGNNYYSWWYSYGSTGNTSGAGRDDIGRLYETETIAAPAGPMTGTTAMTANSAVSIADEIIACRDKKVGPSGVDYNTKSFKGPFRTWDQFNLFVDNLVKVGVLKDNRSYFTQQSERDMATQALADMLKANFNPNLHLNELNPDSNLAKHVDKTDMLIHSTEFCFYPPGRFELESLGRVLRPDSTGTTAGGSYVTVAEAKISAVTKLWDCRRETSQKDFYAGDFKASDYAANPTTLSSNSGYQLEIGNEPDQGDAPSENEYSGYIGLSTVGGDGQSKAKNTTMTTPQGSSDLGAWLYAHYQRDFDANYHKYGPQWRKEANRNNLTGSTGGFPNPEDTATNHETKWMVTSAKTRLAPYDHAYPQANMCRGCRSFKSPTSTAPSLTQQTPSDFRIDGAYSERNHAPGYIVMNGVEMEHSTITTTTTTGGTTAT